MVSLNAEVRIHNPYVVFTFDTIKDNIYGIEIRLDDLNNTQLFYSYDNYCYENMSLDFNGDSLEYLSGTPLKRIRIDASDDFYIKEMKVVTAVTIEKQVVFLKIIPIVILGLFLALLISWIDPIGLLLSDILKEKNLKIIIIFGVRSFAASIIVAFLIEKIIIHGEYFNFYRVCFIASSFLLEVFWIARKKIYQYAHLLFFKLCDYWRYKYICITY